MNTLSSRVSKFIALLYQELGAEVYREMQRRNRAEADDRICHSYDFCDANSIMLEVFETDTEVFKTEHAMFKAMNEVWSASAGALGRSDRRKRIESDIHAIWSLMLRRSLFGMVAATNIVAWLLMMVYCVIILICGWQDICWLYLGGFAAGIVLAAIATVVAKGVLRV